MNKSEKAKQLFKKFKQQKFSIEELKQFVQLDVELIRAFTDVLKSEIDADFKSYKDIVEFFNKECEYLLAIIKDGNITKEEKDNIYAILKDINDKIAEIEKNRENNSNSIKKFLVTCTTFIVSIVIIIFGRNKK